jgi:hypothetical protein
MKPAAARICASPDKFSPDSDNNNSRSEPAGADRFSVEWTSSDYFP